MSKGTLQEAMGKERFPGYPTRSRLSFIAFLAFVIARYVQIGARRDILASIRFEFLLGIAVIIIVGMQLSNRGPDISRAKPLLISIGLLFFAMVIQLPLAADPVMAKSIFLDRVIKFAFLTFFMVVMIESPRSLGLFLATFLFSVFYITLESVQGLVSGGLVWQNQGTMRLHGAVPIYEHPNSLGGVAMGTLPYVVFLFFRVRRWALRIGLVVLAGLSLVCIIYSGSRTAYVGLLVFIMWWFFQSEKKGRFIVLALITSVVVISVIPDQYIERFNSISGEEKESHSKEARIRILQDAWAILQENPLGVGIASFPAVRQQKFGKSQDTHNLYLEVGTNLGWQGLAVFLALVANMLREFRKTAFSFRSQIRQLMAVSRTTDMDKKTGKALRDHLLDLQFLYAVAQATAGFIVTRLALGLFGMDLYEVYWWFGAGFAIVLSGLVASTLRRTRYLVQALGVYR